MAHESAHPAAEKKTITIADWFALLIMADFGAAALSFMGGNGFCLLCFGLKKPFYVLIPGSLMGGTDVDCPACGGDGSRSA